MSVNASQNDLGCILLQDNLPVAYGSIALTETERRYAQIEEKILAIAYGCEKFREYIFDKKVTIENDHKPLGAIFQKSHCDAPAGIKKLD